DMAVPPQERWDDVLLKILGSLNVCSKHWIIRQYDHEVQAGSVVKPLVGVACDGPSDAAVVRPLLDSAHGLVISNGMNPRYGDLDPYWMAAAAIDEAVRNCVAVGADPKRISILDNFCWGNTDRPETLGSLVRAALACQDTAVAYGLPFISGKDSLNNDFSYVDKSGEKQTVSIPPSLLISAMGQMEDVTRAVTMDLKESGNVLFVLGTTKAEFGGSHFGLVLGVDGGDVPTVDFATAPKLFAALHEAIQHGLIRSCHDLSEGGLATALAEMAFAGGYGVEVDLDRLAGEANLNDGAALLFSESCTRFVVEVREDVVPKLTAAFTDLPCVRIGHVAPHDHVHIILDGTVLIDSSINDLKAAWQRPLDWD
ncbi:MAG TPA: AIR synthase-related protein, partial [Planctomycetaceae bacterium]|nr:AIR synthase-related protein [Planctomycetaceae bacterium]